MIKTAKATEGSRLYHCLSNLVRELENGELISGSFTLQFKNIRSDNYDPTILLKMCLEDVGYDIVEAEEIGYRVYQVNFRRID